MDDRVANLLFSRFQVHGIVPARLSMFPILLMSSKASLKVSTKEGIERTIVLRGNNYCFAFDVNLM